MPKHTEKEIIALFKNGHNQDYVFNILVNDYKERLYWHIRKILISHDDTDDVLQNTFIKAWKGLAEFREDSNLFTWLYRIATNEALSFLRNRKRASFLPWTGVESKLSETLESDDYFNADEVQLKLQKAILDLPEKQRLVFNMKYYDELKYEEISEILDTSVGALKASYHHAVKKIEKYMNDN
ncbi:MAG: RNA polymerase sigma factor [Bacteroidales bacterium]|nr:RNA polymerase sigma factor [Bacteroidales bacterium]MCB8999262.1 RNA polymerase sigma factor [Bacteroidales bacterium]MCB9013070.1 RNA polymerase sigma factor [Bacteroidales bacterium]